jgi:hypothetical protein
MSSNRITIISALNMFTRCIFVESLIAFNPPCIPDALFLILWIAQGIRRGPYLFQPVCLVDPGPGHHGTGGEQMKRYYANQERAAGLHGRAHPSLHGNGGHQAE